MIRVRYLRFDPGASLYIFCCLNFGELTKVCFVENDLIFL